MTLLVPNKPLAALNTNITATILDASAGPHALTFVGSKQVVTIVNGDVGSITVNFLGDGVTTFNCPGLGSQNVSAGDDQVVAAGDTVEYLVSAHNGFMGADGNNVVLTITSATSLSSIWLSEYN